MRWQIAEYIFCDQQQSLLFALEVQQLEPMMVELLSYFCQHPDQIISKDQLIDQVWQGRIVSDNAVSRLITKLRKAFNDDVRQPKFIATFPKKGYKFIAQVSPLADVDVATVAVSEVAILDSALSAGMNHDNAVKNINTKQTPDSKHTTDHTRGDKRIYLKLLTISVITLTVLLFLLRDKSAEPVASYAKMITSDAGSDFFPAFSPDGSLLAYMVRKPDSIHLMVKNIQDQSVVEIEHGQGIGVGPADWSDDGKWLAYLVATPQQCQYFVRPVDNFTFGEPQLIHNCPAGSYGEIIFSHDNNRLIYAENEGPNTPYSLFEIDITTNKTRRLRQPELYLDGNSQFDLHPTQNKLLVSSPDHQQWEGFYSLDLDSDELTLLFKKDAYICCGIWNHSGDRVVLMGEHPAYQLVSHDLSGNDQQVIYSGSRQIRLPRRHSNGRDYLFTSGNYNGNVFSLNLANNEQQMIADAGVDERLASFANTSQHIAYISLASGNEEIWLFDQATGQRRKLSHFNDGRHYIDLIWSPDDKVLAALTLNEIHLIDIVDGTFRRLKIPQTEIRGLSFKNNQELSYSVKENERWRVYRYQLTNNTVIAAEQRWQFIQYHHDVDNTIWLDQDDKLFVGAEAKPVQSSTIIPGLLMNGRQFNLKKRGNFWYWFAVSPVRGIVQWHQLKDKTTSLVATDTMHFDVTDEQLIFGDVKQVDANIFQTQTLE